MSTLKVPDCNLPQDFGHLLESATFSDMTLKVEDKVYPVHKAILAARSPVFAAMFNHDLEETKLGVVSITDLDTEVLREMLKFIYTGKVAQLDTMADALLAAADKVSILNCSHASFFCYIGPRVYPRGSYVITHVCPLVRLSVRL